MRIVGYFKVIHSNFQEDPENEVYEPLVSFNIADNSELIVEFSS